MSDCKNPFYILPLFCVTCLFSVSAYCQNNASDKENNNDVEKQIILPIKILQPIEEIVEFEYFEPEDENPDFNFWASLDSLHQDVSTNIESVAKNIDIYFADAKIYQESTNSQIQLTYYTLASEGGYTENKAKIRAKLDLPKTKKKLRVVFESNAEDELKVQPDSPQNRQVQSTTEETRYFAGIEASTPKSPEPKWEYRSSLGVRLHFPLDLYARASASRDFRFSELWAGRFSESLFWFDSTGWATNTTLEFDYKVADNKLFRVSNTAIWTEQNNYWDFGHNYSLSHQINHKNAIAYEFGVFGTSEPTVFINNYRLAVRYRYKLHKDWLYFDIQPELNFPKNDDFDELFSILFRIELVFHGKYYPAK